MKYVGCFYKAFPNKPTWHRDFLVPDSITLETFSVIIQKILNWNWDESSIYIFYINGINYAHFGFKSFIIRDLPEGKYLSCDIPLREFWFKETDQFNYHYDMNIRHNFLITIKSIIETAKETKKVSIWLSSKGQNPNQFPDPVSCFRLDGSAPKFTLPQEIPFTEPRLNKWKVRFITIKDAKRLDTWRKSNDKRKWEKAVVIFDNRGVGPGYLSLQIERPESTVKRWIGEGPIIELVPLPSHSQSLNVIESVFSGMKRAVIHHSDYQTEEETKSAISLHFVERNSFFRENPKRVGKKI